MNVWRSDTHFDVRTKILFMLFLHFYVGSDCVEGAEQAVFDSYDLGDFKGLPLEFIWFYLV